MAGIQAPPTSPASPFADTVDTVEQAIRGAIQSMLLAGASCDDILFMVKTHRDSKEVGILADLDTMSAVPTEDLAERIHDIVILLRSTNDLPVSVEPELSEDLNEGPETLSQDIDPTNNPPEANRPRRLSRNPRGCPYNGWKCKDKKGTARWRSKTELLEHYKSYHLDELRHGDRIACPSCAHAPFPGDGCDFIQHLWFNHMGGPRA